MITCLLLQEVYSSVRGKGWRLVPCFEALVVPREVEKFTPARILLQRVALAGCFSSRFVAIAKAFVLPGTFFQAIPQLQESWMPLCQTIIG